MKPDLYKNLGVPRNATRDEVKRAYRRRAKECHPDAGNKHPGAVVKWHAVQEAYDTLVDDSKRARYDETGDVGGGDAVQKKAAASLAALFQVLAQRADTKHDDLVHYAKNEIENAKKLATAKASEAMAKASKLRDAAARLTAKEGAENFLSAALEAQATVAEREADASLEECKCMFQALEMLKAFSYRTDARDAQQWPSNANAAMFSSFRFSQ